MPSPKGKLGEDVQPSSPIAIKTRMRRSLANLSPSRERDREQNGLRSAPQNETPKPIHPEWRSPDDQERRRFPGRSHSSSTCSWMSSTRWSCPTRSPTPRPATARPCRRCWSRPEANLPPDRIKTLAYDKAADTDEVHGLLDRPGITPADPDAGACGRKSRSGCCRGTTAAERGP